MPAKGLRIGPAAADQVGRVYDRLGPLYDKLDALYE
jgi:hypothetical protein